MRYKGLPGDCPVQTCTSTDYVHQAGALPGVLQRLKRFWPNRAKPAKGSTVGNVCENNFTESSSACKSTRIDFSMQSQPKSTSAYRVTQNRVQRTEPVRIEFSIQISRNRVQHTVSQYRVQHTVSQNEFSMQSQYRVQHTDQSE